MDVEETCAEVDTDNCGTVWVIRETKGQKFDDHQKRKGQNTHHSLNLNTIKKLRKAGILSDNHNNEEESEIFQLRGSDRQKEDPNTKMEEGNHTSTEEIP